MHIEGLPFCCAVKKAAEYGGAVKREREKGFLFVDVRLRGFFHVCSSPLAGIILFTSSCLFITSLTYIFLLLDLFLLFFPLAFFPSWGFSLFFSFIFPFFRRACNYSDFYDN